MEIVVLVILAGLFYWGLIRGNLFPPLALFIGVIGGRTLFIHWIPSTAKPIMTFMGYEVSIAAFISALIMIMAFGYFLKDDDQ